MTPDFPRLDPERSVDAAEVALGLLEGEDRAAAERRIALEPAFAAEVERWRAHFAALFADYVPVAPDAAIEGRVLAAQGGAANDAVASAGAAPWRWATALTGSAAAVLLAMLVLRPEPAPVPVPGPAPVPAQVAPQPSLVAAITPTPDATGPRSGTVAPTGVVFDPARGLLRLAAGVSAPAGRSAQLWRIGADGVPHSLGLLAATGPTRLRADAAMLAAGVTLAISIEPIGGAPGTTPTGPVVATGTLAPG